MRKIIFYAAFLCFIIMSFLSSKSSAVMKGLSTEELTRGSTVIIMGKVENVEAQWSCDKSTIYSRASIVIDDVIKGLIIQDKIIVEYEGGEVGDIGLKVSDVSPLKKGETIILFLKADKRKDVGVVYNITGKAQGKYVIGEDGIARKSGFSLINGEDFIDNEISVDELIDKIRGIE
jgi:hypothetical protein